MSPTLSVILIQIDSLNRHFLPCYGNTSIHAPTLAAFAQRAAVFDRHFVGSLPCMPARREIWTGTAEWWWRGWGPLEPWDQTLAYIAGRHGVTTQLVTDHYHLFEWGSHSYPYDYAGYDFIRGHEYDNWRTDPITDVPLWAERMVERLGDAAKIYLRNVQHFQQEADFFAPQVMQTTANWLDRNHTQSHFFLHVDCFDVHEPFHIPEPYRSLYTDDDHRRYSPWPLYGRVDDGRSALRAAELDWVRAQFAGKLTMVDTWLARVFERLDRYHLWERTCVIVTTDHGHYLGDHGWIGKPDAPLYHTLCHVPLLVWHPHGAHNGGRIDSITQTVDLYATVLDLLGASPSDGEHVHSRSFAPVLMGQQAQHRDYAVYAYNNQRVGVTMGEWTLLRDHDATQSPAYWYTHQVDQLHGRSMWMRGNRPHAYPHLEAGRFVPGVDMPVWRTPSWQGERPMPHPPRADLLFNNADDPAQEHDLAKQRPDMVEQIAGVLRAHAERIGAPREQRLRLRL